MTRFKRGKALFDVLSEESRRGRNPLEVPDWWNKTDTQEAPPAPPRREHEVSPPRRIVEPSGAEDDGEERGPWVDVDGDRIRVSLTSLRAALVIFGVAVTLLGAFEAGRSVGSKRGFANGYQAGRTSFEAETLDELEAARNQPPATYLVESLLASPDAEVGPPPEEDGAAAPPTPDDREPVWIAGYTYVVAQEFSPGREQYARTAQEYLARHGVETELVRYASGAMQLMTTRGFDRSDPGQRAAADDFLARVHSIGSKYFSSGGGYKLEGYFKTYKGDNW